MSKLTQNEIMLFKNFRALRNGDLTMWTGGDELELFSPLAEDNEKNGAFRETMRPHDLSRGSNYANRTKESHGRRGRKSKVHWTRTSSVH